MRTAATAAKGCGYLFVVMLIAYLVFMAYDIWSRHKQLEWQVAHPQRGTDVQKLAQYFTEIEGVEACAWAEGLQKTDDFMHPYVTSFYGFLKMTPDVRATITRDLGPMPTQVDDAESLPYLKTSFAVHKPCEWYVTRPPSFEIISGYYGTYYYEKVNGIVYFRIRRIPD